MELADCEEIMHGCLRSAWEDTRERSLRTGGVLVIVGNTRILLYARRRTAEMTSLVL